MGDLDTIWSIVQITHTGTLGITQQLNGLRTTSEVMSANNQLLPIQLPAPQPQDDNEMC